MLVTIAINEREPLFEVGFARWAFRLRLGGYYVHFEKPLGGGDYPFTWETKTRDFPATAPDWRPTRHHTAHVLWGNRELLLERIRPIRGTVALDLNKDDEGGQRPWGVRGWDNDEDPDD